MVRHMKRRKPHRIVAALARRHGGAGLILLAETQSRSLRATPYTEREGVSQDRSPCPPRNTLIASLLLLVSTHVVGATMQFPTPPKPFRN